jgi:RNA 3'-terminal phosphate cyclase (ATP)
MIEIDGSYGEGGGQVLRTSLAFSAILKVPVTVHHIRAGRKNPGLQPQHLKGVEALAQIARAQTEGVKMGSEKITFVPSDIFPGGYEFDVGTAGSVALLLQVLLPPLCLCRECSHLTLVGGTHVAWSPPFHYLSEILFPTLSLMGVSVTATIERWGWYPKGGGIVHVEIRPSSGLKSISLIDRGPLMRIHGVSATTNLPRHIAKRQKDDALRRIREALGMDAEITIHYNAPAHGAGSFLFLVAESEKAIAGFSSLGEKGKRAEEVAKEAVNGLINYIDSDGCIGPQLADQIVPFMALGKGNSSFTTSQITNHLLTNLWVIQHFFDMKISRWGEEGEKGRIDFI